MEIVKSAPVPARVTTWGLPAALSVMVRVPASAPTAGGVNVTLMVQLPPAVTVPAHVFVWAKFTLALILAIVKVAVPEFVSVTGWAALVAPTGWPVKVRLVAERLTSGAGAPTPESRTVCGLPGALSVTASEPLLLPEAVGVNVTLILQLAPAATLAPQLFIWAKAPVSVIPVIARGAVPVLVRVTACAALVVPAAWLAKLTVVGKSVTAGANPTPASRMDWGLSKALSVRVTEPLRLPTAVGANVTLRVQLASPATLAPQVVATAKSPVTVVFVMVRGAPPLFVKATVKGALLAPTGTPGNVRLVGARVTAGRRTALPLRDMT